MIRIGSVKFEWDAKKAVANLKKHRVSFEEATTIFLNAPLKVFFDPEHSENEDRYVAIGLSLKSRVLVVVHCESRDGRLVRIISARRATKREEKDFSGE